ncbi:Recombinase [Arthrobacter sp. 9V]|uniref:recombinase family protein n=1 Tax=Arthrobacter sp. 9V TaxID=2653132 RepID=UPI0012F1C1D9|nr:recombinase family protein [Arthrobacter sp. 9V]VXB26031.1 Recombinase [Arthrobacter sp. 9V]
MKAAIYTRVSVDRTANARSVTSQEQECRAEVERRGWQASAIYTDNDRSASRFAKKNRPHFDQLMVDIAAKKFDVVVTWEASRATRDLEVYVALRAVCRAAGVQWSYSGKLYDLTRPDDAFSTGLDALISERESDQTRERIMRAMRQTAATGKPHGKIPYGYAREYDNSTGVLIRQYPHPEEAPVVREAAKRVLAGESMRKIAQDLKSRGLMSQTQAWAPARLTELLKSPTLAGYRVYQGKIIGDAAWEPVIDRETFHALQGILGDPSRSKQRGSAPAQLLTGIATCGVCDGSMVRRHTRGKDQYQCRVNYCASRNVEKTDAYVAHVLLQKLQEKSVMDTAAAVAGEDTSPMLDEISALEARLNGFYQQAADGSLTPQGLARVETSILNQLQSKRQALASASKPKTATLDAECIVAGWDGLELMEQREVVRSMMKVRILRAGRGHSTFDPSLIEITWLP